MLQRTQIKLDKVVQTKKKVIYLKPSILITL